MAVVLTKLKFAELSRMEHERAKTNKFNRTASIRLLRYIYWHCIISYLIGNDPLAQVSVYSICFRNYTDDLSVWNLYTISFSCSYNLILGLFAANFMLKKLPFIKHPSGTLEAHIWRNHAQVVILPQCYHNYMGYIHLHTINRTLWYRVYIVEHSISLNHTPLKWCAMLPSKFVSSTC